MDQKMKRGLLDPAVWSVGTLLSDHEIAVIRGGDHTTTQQVVNGEPDIPN